MDFYSAREEFYALFHANNIPRSVLIVIAVVLGAARSCS